MNNADRQVLSAIATNPFPLAVSVPKLAEIVTSLRQEIEELKARLAEKPSLKELPAHHWGDSVSSGDGKVLIFCRCGGWESGWVALGDGTNALYRHIAVELYGYVPDSELDAAVEPSPRPFLSNTATDEAVES